MMCSLLRSIAILYLFLQGSDGLECYHCSNVTGTKDCSTKLTCPQGQKCYTSTHGVGLSETFDLGCKSEHDCLPGGGDNSFVGRSVGDRNNCFQCCQVDNCNRNLCSDGIQVINEVGQCADDPSFDCAGVSSSFNICIDIHHAKVKCRKFCGLCNLVDGSWSVWSSWSQCDVTCGSGHMTRTRTCSDPAPAHGGLDCVGDSKEISTCVLDTCPVHGGWSLWSPWGYCSVTCGIGLERRDRSCSNPYPSRDGDHCYGDSRDDRPCFIKACADGLWSTWSDWGSCSASCLGGLQQRTRTCDNPAPTDLGHVCVGNNEEYQSCNNKECPHVEHDGLWSTWSDWGSCSATCLGGLQQRTRTCDNPAPTDLGHVCVGTNEEYQSCNNKECPHGLPVFFRATHSSNVDGLSSGRTIIYTNTEINEGGGYDNSTGIFTAPETGIYMFVVQICMYAENYYHVEIVKDGQTEATSYLYNADAYICDSTNVLVSLVTGNKVWVKITAPQILNQDSYRVNMFQGTKIGV